MSAAAPPSPSSAEAPAASASASASAAVVASADRVPADIVDAAAVAAQLEAEEAAFEATQIAAAYEDSELVRDKRARWGGGRTRAVKASPDHPHTQAHSTLGLLLHGIV